MEKLHYAWFSRTAADKIGFTIYLDETGNEVVCTCVAKNLDFVDQYHFEDKVYVGVVTKFVRRVRPEETIEYYKF